MSKRYLLPVLLLASSYLSATDSWIRMPHHARKDLTATAKHVGRRNAAAQMQIRVPLKPASNDALELMIKRINDPNDAFYHKYLTSDEFYKSFGPAASDRSAIVQFLKTQGLTVDESSDANPLAVNASASVETIERAFQIELHDYQTEDGRQVFAPSSDPLLPANLIEKIHGISGLQNFAKLQTYTSPGHGAAGGYSPQDVRKAYNLDSLKLAGDGETIALFEIGGYALSDITQFNKLYSITGMPAIKNVLLNNAPGTPLSGTQSEVTLDIEQIVALAPHAQLIVYELGANSTTQFSTVLGQIAKDNKAKVVSMSYGTPEYQMELSELQALDTIFRQMAAQGQTMVIASGDSGAYAGDDYPNLHASGPASEPYATAIGGTSLVVNADGSYASETSWNNEGTAAKKRTGGGGGISQVWQIPDWQKGLGTDANKGSKTNRMVPDVSLNAKPATGYAFFVAGASTVIGGTSASAPSWAAFLTLTNQQRVNSGLSRLGFVTPALYQIAQSSLYASVFHDIKDGSDNQYYPAVAGYDLSTGLGSFQGGAMLAALSNPVLPPAAPINVTAKVVSQ